MEPSGKGPVVRLSRARRLDSARSIRQHLARLVRRLDAGLVPQGEMEGVRLQVTACRALIDCLAAQAVEERREERLEAALAEAQRTLARISEERRLAERREETRRVLADAQQAQAQVSEPVPDGEG